MRIAINAQLCSSSSSCRNAGISRYIRNLVHAIGRIECSSEMHLFLPGANRDPFPANFTVHHRSPQTEDPLARIAWEQLVLPCLVRRLRVDILHSPMHVLPAVCPTRSVVSIMDLAFLRYPETFPRQQRRYLEFCTRNAVRKADAVLTISESTRQDVIEMLGADPDRVFTTLLAADDAFVPASGEQVEAARRRYGTGPMSILYLGTLEPRKNIPTLLAAFSQMHGKLGPECRLVISGGKGWLYDEVFQRIEDLGLRDSVRFTGYVPREDMPALYSSAGLFVYPSLYEGFGLPPLEAMACGTPVITSNTSSLPEVVGDAGIMVDPLNAEELADAMLRVLQDPALRSDMSRNGLERARKFSWERTAKQTLDVYQDVYRRSHG